MFLFTHGVVALSDYLLLPATYSFFIRTCNIRAWGHCSRNTTMTNDRLKTVTLYCGVTVSLHTIVFTGGRRWFR